MSLALLLLASLPGSLPPPEFPAGFLYQPAFCVDYCLREPARPYVPQPGDLYLSTEDKFINRFAHKVVHSGGPHHSGIVFALPDGCLALLEGGPESTLWIRVLDLIPSLSKYYQTKRVWIRQRQVPLTPEQSRRLTAFALAVAGKRFALVRMVLQGGPFRVKGPIRTPLFGRPHAAGFDPDDPEPYLRARYYCSELVAEACVAAGLFDPVTSRPPSVYPRELFFGTSNIPYLREHLDMSAWCPPARWAPWPGAPANIEHRPWIDNDGCHF
jgi:hypothetical protein